MRTRCSYFKIDLFMNRFIGFIVWINLVYKIYIMDKDYNCTDKKC